MRQTPDRGDETETAMDQAIAWHLRLKDPIATPSDHAGFEAWLRADPGHRLAYEDARTLWDEALAPARVLGADGWHRQKVSPRRRTRLGLAMAGLVLALLGGGALWRDPGIMERALADHATAPGRVAQITLPDGSHAYLDGDSAISVIMDGNRRDVLLRRGRAWFDVARREGPSFRVVAGDVVVRDISTQFAVERAAAATLVTVEQGEVAVSTPGTPEARVLVGQRMRVESGRMPPPEAVEPGVTLAWRRGLVVFDRAPLSAVVEQLDRMEAGRVLLADPALRGMTLSGVFRANDQAAVLSALRSALGLRVTRVPGLLVLITR
jgi:transmembrane sensor